MVKVSVVHFQPLEKYPPVMNLLHYLQEKNKFTIHVYSSKDKFYKNKLFKVPDVKIYRPSVLNKGQLAFSRYFNYINFNVLTFLQLIITNPASIVCYETLSIFPVYLYKKIFTTTKILLHYHEYASLNEISKSSLYIKWLNRLEKKVFSKACWISHTNEERLSMFKRDYKYLPFSNLQILPNYPPSLWYRQSGKKAPIITFPVKFVYVGALGMDTMYTREFAEWIKELNGKAIWDIYSGNYQENILTYIETLNCPFISFKGEVNYYQLPEVLNKYDVGLILYNGHIPNYVYNAPNKLFEYHACDLDVWVSEDITGSLPYVREYTYPKILRINFKDLEHVNLLSVFNKESMRYCPFSYTADSVFSILSNEL